MAGFQVAINGRFWVATEGVFQTLKAGSRVGPNPIREMRRDQ